MLALGHGIVLGDLDGHLIPLPDPIQQFPETHGQVRNQYVSLSGPFDIPSLLVSDEDLARRVAEGVPVRGAFTSSLRLGRQRSHSPSKNQVGELMLG